MNAKASHLIAIVLVSAGQILQFLNTNPALAAQMHLTAQILTVAGFLVALASQQLFGTPVPPPQAPLAGPPAAPKVDPVTAAAAKLSGVLMLAFLAGCSLFSHVAPPAVAAVGCIVDDAAKGDTVAQIVVDCGGDVAQVIAVLTSPTAPAAVQGSKALDEAKRAKAALAGVQ